MNRTEYEEVTHHMHHEILVNQFGGRAFTKEEDAFLTEVHEGTEAFEATLNTLMEAGMLSSDNLGMSLVDADFAYHGRCRTQQQEGRYVHLVELNTRTQATLLHELAHVFCFDNGIYDSYKELGDENAHNADFDQAMKSLINVTLAGRA